MIGRLEFVSLRDVWVHEAYDFTQCVYWRPSGTPPMTVEVIANYRKSYLIGDPNRRRSEPPMLRFYE